MNASLVSLKEWETLRPLRGSPLAKNDLIGDADHSRKLAEVLSESGRIEVLELATGLELRATSFVGRFKLGELVITVHPKLAGLPLLNLLRYAYDLRQLSLYDAVDYSSEKWAFQDLLVHQLAAEADELIARVVHRDYERTEGDLANPHGRINFGRLLKISHRGSATLPCTYYPRTEDNLLNQLVLAGLQYAARTTEDGNLRAHLNRLSKTLGGTVSLRTLSMTLLADSQRSIDRRTRAYQPAVTLIDLLMRAEGMSLDTDFGGVRLRGFLFDMNRFFQMLVSKFLHDHLENCEVEDERRLKELFGYDSDRNPQRRRAPVQKPDFVIRRNRQIVAVLDAKYRDLWESSLPRDMLYQLALYALGQTGSGRKAVILYPTISTKARDQAIVVREPASGRSQAEVILRPINMVELGMLVRADDQASMRRKSALAKQFAFGSASA